MTKDCSLQKTTSIEHVVYTGPLQVFGQTVNTISTRGPDYAHHSNPSPPGLSDLATGLIWIQDWLLTYDEQDVYDQFNIFFLCLWRRKENWMQFHVKFEPMTTISTSCAAHPDNHILIFSNFFCRFLFSLNQIKSNLNHLNSIKSIIK